MHLPRQTSLLTGLFLWSASSLVAQTAPNPSGHWEGAIQAPKGEVRIEVDLAQDSAGALTGTFGNPTEHLKGLPLRKIAVENTSISFHFRSDQSFKGVLSADGTSMVGDFRIATAEGEFSVPFSLTRTGEARIEAAPKSAPIGKELEGTWNGTLDVKEKQLRVVLTMSNHADGTSTGNLVNLDEGALEMPVTIVQKGASLTVDVKATGGSYSGVLNAAGTELVGTYTTRQGLALPLTFQRAAETTLKKF